MDTPEIVKLLMIVGLCFDMVGVWLLVLFVLPSDTVRAVQKLLWHEEDPWTEEPNLKDKIEEEYLDKGLLAPFTEAGKRITKKRRDLKGTIAGLFAITVGFGLQIIAMFLS